MSHESPQRNSAYLRTLAVWEGFYPATQIFIGFFDQLARNPRDLLRRIYEFLAVDSSAPLLYENAHRNTKKRRNTSTKIPADIARHLASLLLDEIGKLHGRFANEFTAKWLENARECLS